MIHDEIQLQRGVMFSIIIGTTKKNEFTFQLDIQQ